ncbi:hypothetical protein Pmani_010527 [Petrolisthes manimaculis]|uniref:Transmembrane protein 231 n=1 Tax=Petrolisthes manimaculis TaxID=1843537 RepID=A0AAE1UH77_9EUCA|nr:hypothetical protein Pmani_010527 [Petrolisthes manimaculis]
MGIHVVHQSPQVISYKTTYCSKATLFNILTLIVTVITPLLVVYRSQGLWVKETEWREQADIRFKHQVLFIADTSLGPLVWSTNSAFNTLMAAHLRPPLVKSHEADGNHDGVKERLEFTLELPLKSTELVYGATLLLTFDYRLHHMCEIILEGLGHVRYSGGIPVSGVSVWGDLTLHQRHPLPHTPSFTLYNTPILPTASSSPTDWRLDTIFSQYFQRNYTTRLDNTYTSVRTGESDIFTLTIHVTYPEQRVTSLPGFWLTIKWAWVQYLSVLLVLIYVTSFVKDWAYRSQLVPTWVDSPQKLH